MDGLSFVTKKVRRLGLDNKPKIAENVNNNSSNEVIITKELTVDQIEEQKEIITIIDESLRDKLRDQTLLEPKGRWYVIYVITNEVDGKKYVGQAVSHIKIKDKYKPYAAYGRLLAHFREANSKKKHQCAYLNNAIRAHGREKFTVETLVECEKKEVDALEVKYIREYNSTFPNGYNIMKGGRSLEGTEASGNEESVPRKSPSLEHKLEMAERTRRHYRKLKMQACIEYFKDKVLCIFDAYILKGKDHDQYTCYMLLFKKEKPQLRAVFGGQHMDLDSSFHQCVDFYNELRENLAKRLDAGNTLESESTTQC